LNLESLTTDTVLHDLLTAKEHRHQWIAIHCPAVDGIPQTATWATKGPAIGCRCHLWKNKVEM